jgi:glutathione S-transferase
VKLYAFPVAPNPTKVALYVAEKRESGAEMALEEVTVDLRKGEQRSAEHRARNPFARLPVLELDDGSFLCESLAIVEYLEERYPEPPMIGSNPQERARVRELERIADLGVLIPVARIVHATNSPLGLPPRPEVASMFRELLPQSLEVLDQRLADGRPFLAGDRPSVADCTLAAGLQFGRFGGVPLDPDYSHLARWDRAFRERPVAKAVLLL